MDRRRSQSCSHSDTKSHEHTDESCKVISKLLLPEDLMIYIFTLVPLNCLIDSARYVCKPWADTIGSSHFVEACGRRRRSKISLYVENGTTRRNSYMLEFKDDVNGQFERTDFGTPQEMGHLISTCDGIFLLWNERHGSREIVVVNPLLKCWLRISRFPDYPFRESLEYIVASCQCNITRVPRTAKFKLFLMDSVKFSGAFWFVFYVLRIGIDNSWEEIARKESPRPSWNIFWQQLYSGGNDIYWITKSEVIVMDVDKEVILQEYPLPHLPNYSELKYLLMGNRISCIASKDLSSTTYQIYILDFDSGKWSLYHEMGPFDYVAACGLELDIIDVVFRFWINDQIIFRVSLGPVHNNSDIFKNKKYMHFGYNVKTRQLTKIEGIAEGNFEVWLHTNSLVSLPRTPT
ncbi:uncharacterized protein LOC123884539 [Trifolium pratense]|uniref:uncharacterized protein LOC123884539 n=1 Tax=Trifolium pratense TaxID=57577 RepID=UPI001E696B74|nr:uncharacterized protein LOC123884539 [Trifolium pratense]